MRPSPKSEVMLLDAYAHQTMSWILASIHATKNRGSAAWYHPVSGWSKAYPETTGYLIESIFDAARALDIPDLRDVAFNCANWLLSIQLADGSFRGGVGGKLPPIVFDTGMILFGLRRAWEESKEEEKAYLLASDHALRWLDKHLSEDGVWQRHAYVQGYLPSYYTMVVWAMARVNHYLENFPLRQKLERALHYFTGKITPELTVRDWSFRPGEPAFTHTIGYTLQGMLEAGLLLENEKAVAKVEAIARKMMQIRQVRGILAGSFDEQWKPDYSFGCLTGQAQMSVIFFRLHELTGDSAFLEEAETLFWQLTLTVCNIKREGWYGGISGSRPIWGKYQRFRFVNWAAKFFMDAMLKARQHKIEFGEG